MTPTAFSRDALLARSGEGAIHPHRNLRWLTLLALLLLEIVGIYALYRNWREEIRGHEAQEQASLDIAYRAAVNMFRLASETHNRDLSRNADIFATFRQGLTAADADTASRFRGKLYRDLYPVYAQMRKDSFRQFQFHGADGRSFLRFHAPTQFGDDVFAKRPSVRLSNRELKPLAGFEIGAVMTGYSYVFPVVSQGRHLGSVEFGVPFSALRDAIAELDKSREYAILLRRDQVDQTANKDYIEMYRTSAPSPDYLVEDPAANLPDALPRLSADAAAVSARLRAMPAIQRAMQAGEATATTLEELDAAWLVMLYPIRDIEGRQTAYLVSYARNPFTLTHQSLFLLQATLFSVLLAGLGYAFRRLFRSSDDLFAERQTLKILTDTMSDALLATDRAGHVIAINPAMTRISGYENAEAMGAWACRLFQDPARPDAEAPASPCQSLASGGRLMREAALYNHDGIEISVELSSTPILEKGEYRGAVTVIRDISERKHSEQALRLAAHVFENTAEGIIITDHDCRILAINRAVTEISGFTQTDVAGQLPSIFSAGMAIFSSAPEMWSALERNGHWHGEFMNRRKDGSTYVADMTISTVRDPVGELTHYVGVFRNVSEQKQSTEMMKRFALHDMLTGLPNRTLLHQRLDKALRDYTQTKTGAALLYLDMDRFKHINDSLGHSIGDHLLQQTSGRLLGSIREGDTLARIGGDEFFILLENIFEHSQADDVANRILADITRPFQIDPLMLHMTCSIGISFFPEDGTDIESLVRKADMAMYEAKKQGRNSFRCFDPALLGKAAERLDIGNALHGVVERGELRVFYQPQNRAGDGGCEGVEALVRWFHPTRGVISPAVFIPIAEDIGLIAEIGAWVLRESCRQLAEWRADGIGIPRVAVNLSVQQLEQTNLPACVAEALGEFGLQASDLELEVTESMIMNRADKIIAILDQLSEMGVKLAVDDFGTGYSSLAYLKHLPVHRLKIDQSFVRDLTSDPDDRAIARVIIALGHNLGMDVLAEGVETEAQARFLHAENCDVLQGYLFSKPLPAEELGRQWRERYVLPPLTTNSVPTHSNAPAES